ncbi:hypothetical protein D3C83_132210 [compost metagenome]
MREAEEQRDAGERQEERGWKAADDLLDGHAAEVDADEPRQHERQEPDVDRGRATERQGNQESRQGNGRKGHGSRRLTSISRRRS